MIDSRTNTATVKIVNLLPFDVTTTLKFANRVDGKVGLGTAQVKATMTVLSGNPDDVNVRPSEPEELILNSETIVHVKPFSLTVLSFPLK